MTVITLFYHSSGLLSFFSCCQHLIHYPQVYCLSLFNSCPASFSTLFILWVPCTIDLGLVASVFARPSCVLHSVSFFGFSVPSFSLSSLFLFDFVHPMVTVVFPFSSHVAHLFNLYVSLV